MAFPGLIKGQLLSSDLQRNSINIGIENDLLYVDVNNQRIGINNGTPVVELDVNGKIKTNAIADYQLVFCENGGELTSEAGFEISLLTNQITTPGGYVTGTLTLTDNGIDSLAPFTISTSANQDISITPGSGGETYINGLQFPESDGLAGNVLVTNGSGILSFDELSSSFNLAANQGVLDTFNLGGASTLTFTGTTGIDTIVSDDTITINGVPASTSSQGVAMFDSDFFSVNGVGFVSIADNSITATQIAPSTITGNELANDSVDSSKIVDGSVTNNDLQNSSITLGTQNISLGDTETELLGLTLFEVDNFRMDGSTLSTTGANGDISIAPNGDGIIQFSTQSAVVMPTGPQSARPTTLTPGLMRYSTTTNLMEYYNGTEWKHAGESLAVLNSQEITPDGVSDTFALDHPASTTSVIVTLNGLVQSPTTAYSVVGTNIVFTGVPQVTDIIVIRYIVEITAVTGIADSTSGTTQINATPTEITMEVAGQDVVSIPTNKTVDLTAARSLKLPVYTVAAASAIALPQAGETIYVSNGNSGTPCLAVYDGTSWKRVTLGSTISAS